jgi:hypothetical protein
MCKLKHSDEAFGRWNWQLVPIAKRDGRCHDASQTLKGAAGSRRKGARRAPYSHPIVRVGPNELICRWKEFLCLENSRRPNRQQRAGLTATSRGAFRSSASDRITASFADDLPRVSRAIWTVPRDAERTRRAC